MLFLEQTVDQLKDMLKHPRLAAAQRESIGREIQLAATALSHYRRAFEIEQKLKNKLPN